MTDSSRYFAVLYTTGVTVSCMYGLQPILRTLAEAFSVNAATVSLCITVSMLPMGVAPLLYGFVLESVPLRAMLNTALFVLAVLQFAAAAMDSLESFLVLRFLLGLCIPALLTSLITAAAENTGGRSVRASLSLYVASTIVGGLLGRIVTGLIATILGWRAAFILLGLAALAALVLIWRLPPSGNATFRRPRLDVIPLLLSRPGFLRSYLLIFCVFFVNMSLFNVLPFRLAELSHGISDFSTSLAYSGFLVGLAVTSFSVRLSDMLGGKAGTLRLGLLVVLLSFGVFLLPSVTAYILGLVVFCLGFFFVSSLAPGFVAAGASDHRPLANGLYLSFMYAGGTLGSFLPGLAFNTLGHTWYLLILFIVILAALLLCPSHIGMSPSSPPERPHPAG